MDKPTKPATLLYRKHGRNGEQYFVSIKGSKPREEAYEPLDGTLEFPQNEDCDNE